METYQLITLYFDLGMNYKDILDALDPDLLPAEITHNADLKTTAEGRIRQM